MCVSLYLIEFLYFFFFFSIQNLNFNSYFLESADKIGYFFEKDALDENGELLVDSSLALNKAGHALHRVHPTFEECTYDEKVANVCRALGLRNPVVVQSMYIYKNPGIGGEGIQANRKVHELNGLLLSSVCQPFLPLRITWRIFNRSPQF